MGSSEATADRASRDLTLLSVVVPVLDDEDALEAFYERMRSALGGLPFELLVVDDGSTDGTSALLARLSARDRRLRVVTLSRTFGHQTALTAGLDHAAGDAVVMLDGDLQDPPELIRTMLERWRAGADVVYAVREGREGETPFKRASARWFYRLMARLSPTPLPADVGDFRLLDRRALDALLSMRERNRYLRGMTVWIGFTQTAIAYERDPRHAGATKFPPRRMLRFALDAVASFSHVPLQVATVLGFAFAGLAFLGIPVAIGFRIAGQFVPGVTTTIIAVLLLGGIQLIAIGVIGEYVGRIYDEVKRRPLYLVRSRTNLTDVAPVEPAERERITAWWPVRVAVIGAGVTGLVAALRLGGRATRATSTNAGRAWAARPRRSTSAAAPGWSATTTTSSPPIATSPPSTTSSACPARSSGAPRASRCSRTGAPTRSPRRRTSCASARFPPPTERASGSRFCASSGPGRRL